jgi:integral membrane protein (TIGR01906 family)
VTESLRTRLVVITFAVAVALVIVALAILPFLTPPWMSFAQERAEAHAWTGFAEPELRRVTNAIVADLVLGPPEFDVAVDGTAVLNERERSHMRDVRTVLLGLWLLAAASAALLVAGWLLARRRAWYWRSIRVGGIGVAVAVVVIGAISVIAFDAVFEAFHQAFFPGGTYTFDPRTERLVQLFPYQFWFETAFAAGAVILGGGVLAAWIGGRRSEALAASDRHLGLHAVESAR